MDVQAVNSLSYDEFVTVFGNVVEDSPIIAAAMWSRRPFNGVTALEAAISDFIDALPDSGKEGILRCHPDLGARVTLTRESREEQAAAGMGELSSAEALRMSRLNEEYKQRFGFPFVICARMNDKAAIIQQLCTRSKSGRAEERAHGIAEVKKVCHLRLQGLVVSD